LSQGEAQRGADGELIGGKSHPRLLLADDHAIFSDALRLYLDKDFDIVGVVSDGRILVDEAIRIKPDVIIADVGMPLLNGLTLPKDQRAGRSIR